MNTFNRSHFLTLSLLGAAIVFMMADSVTMATKGSSTKYATVKGQLKAVRQIEVERANFSLGCSVVTETINGVKTTIVDGIDPGDILGFYRMNFTDEGLNGVEISYECCDQPSDSATIHFVAKSLDNEPFASFEIQNTAGNFLVQTQYVGSTNLTGVQDVYLKFIAGTVTNNNSYYVAKLDWIAFF